MKKLILIGLIMLLGGCGVPAGEAGADGTNGTTGLGGEDGRDYATPVMRSFTWDTSKTVVCFSDVIGSDIKLSMIAMNLDNNNNYLLIDVPPNNIGKKVQCVINGVVSPEIIVPDNASHSLVFSTLFGTDNTYSKYLSCDRIDHTNENSYIAWYLDNILIEYYYVDAFEGYML